MIRLFLAAVVAVGWVALAVHVAGTLWALPLAAITVFVVFAADRLTFWRTHAPTVAVSRHRGSRGGVHSRPGNTDQRNSV